MIVVADTTPLLYLSRIGRLEVVRAVHGRIIIPQTVWNELVVARPAAPGVTDLLASGWIGVNGEAEQAGVDPELTAALDYGEAAAIALAELSLPMKASA